MKDNELKKLMKLMKIDPEIELVPAVWNQKELDRCDKLSEPKGVPENTYDINYCIRLLETIQNECEKHRVNPSHLFLTMDHSLRKMIIHLKREKSKM